MSPVAGKTKDGGNGSTQMNQIDSLGIDIADLVTKHDSTSSYHECFCSNRSSHHLFSFSGSNPESGQSKTFNWTSIE